mmetsp:Transcript_13204/g.17964  ORF Transcript_13204/g.17964 Transcript_13204/m.17964 type:complete len:129 (+) Transcript_13204:519-905(+)
MVSSFVPRIIDSVIRASTSPPATKPRDFIIQSLRNRMGLPDTLDYAILDETTGVNIFLDYLTEERVTKVHSNGGYVGLWYAASKHTEDAAMWEKVYTTGAGIDFFFSDKPVEAIEARNRHQPKVSTAE